MPLLALAALTVPAVASPPPLAPRAPVSAWSAAAKVHLTRDVAHGAAAAQATTVYVCSDGTYLYVRFDAAQSGEPVIAEQRANNTVVGGSNINGGIAWTDDAVWVDLWPTGPGGFQYQFEANPIGAHNEASSENVDFEPHWRSYGAATPSGYAVTMAIPLAVIHGAHAGTWRLQFVRYVRATGALDVWSSGAAQINPDDPAYSGTGSFTQVSRAPLPKPRIAPYILGEAASRSIGGSTSRVGMDFSIPVAQTASFFGTFHPDYSDVELDQQSISPTVFQRTYSEVRPFFTQAASYYNAFNCAICNGFRTTLYTPGIPTPREGYAFEGRDGLFGLAAFDAIGDRRTDAAAALNYTSPDSHWNGAFQHVITELPGLFDSTSEGGISWSDGKYLSAYLNDAQETGTLVSSPAQGNWIDGGGGFLDQHFALFASMRRVGSQFNPVDGFDSHPGVAGYGFYTARVWTFDKSDVLSSAGVDLFLDRYQGPQYGAAQSDTQVLLDMLTKSSVDLQLYSGSDYWRFGPTMTPISQNGGFSITYHSGTQNNLNNFPAHGSSATPTQIQYYTGRYGTGRLDTWYRSTTLRVGTRGLMTFALDNTAQWMPGNAPDNVQWFEDASYAYQVTPDSSVAIGVRRIVGMPPLPNGGGNCEGVCSNISVAYHLRLKNYELYAAYGNPNTLVTVPQAILKLIFYAGAQKGS